MGLRIKQVNGETGYWGILEELHKAPYLDITVEDNPDCAHRVHPMPGIEAEGSLVLRFSSPCQHEHGSAQPAVLPHVRAGDAGVDQCCICLADVQPDDTLVQLPCKHAFHAVCAGRWLISNKRQRQCPLCKRSVDCSTAGEDSPSPAQAHGPELLREIFSPR